MLRSISVCVAVILMCGFPVRGEQLFYDDFNGDLAAWTFDQGGVVTEADAFVGKRSLTAVGIGESYQYIAMRESIAVKPGERFGLSCSYRVSEGFANGTPMIICLFRDDAGKLVGQARMDFGRRSTWQFDAITFDAPDGASKLDVAVRLAGVPDPHAAFIDGIRLVRIELDDDFHVRSIATTFDGWNPADPLAERCRFGAGGKLLHDWKAAYVGEACIEAHGNNEKFQYPLWISHIAVQAGVQYDAAVHYRTSEGLNNSRAAMVIYFFRDTVNKDVGQERLFLPGVAEWTEAKRMLTPPEGAVRMDIGVRFASIGPEQTVYLDNLRFEARPSAALLDLSIDPDASQLAVALNTTADVIPRDVAAATIAIRKDAGDLVWQRDVTVGQTVEIPIGDWANGAYATQSIVTLADGRELRTEPQTFHVFNDRPWMGHNLGRIAPNDPPPAAWTAVQLAGNTARTWNNTFVFGDALRLREVRCAGDQERSLLTQPMNVRLNGTSLTDAVRFDDVTTEAGKSVTRFATRGSSGDMDVAIEAQVAFDGLVTYRLSLTATQTITLNELQLNLAVRDAEGINYSDGSWTHSGFVDLLDGETWSPTRFFPVVWLGNLERGLYVFCDAVYPAVEEQPRPWIEITPDAAVRIDLVNEPLRLEAGQSHEVRFAFGVTPMRPEAHHWRTMRFRSEPNPNMDLLWGQPQHFAHFGFPESSDDAALDQHLDNSSHLDRRLFYQAPSYGMTSIPQWTYFVRKWTAYPFRAYPKESSMAKWGHDLVKIDITEQSWCDLYLKHFDAFLDRFGFEGVYYDCIGVDSLLQGERYTYPIFALRDFVTRIYNTQRLDRPESFTITHTGANFCSPKSAFSDVILMGEQYRAGCMEHDYYLQFMTLRRFRFECYTRIGADHMFLPQYRQAEKQQSVPIAVHTMGLVMTHNQILYPSFINQDVIYRFQSRKRAFDVTNADFFGYWKSNPLAIETGNDAVIVSYYRNDKGLLLTMLNVSVDGQDVALKGNINRIREAYPDAKVYLYDPLTDETTPWSLGDTTRLNGYMANLVLVSPSQKW
jgi:hypothetical protein